MANIIVPVGNAEMDWPRLRQGIKLCIQAGAPNAIVYSRWPLKFSVGDTVELLKSNRDNDRVHAWIVGVETASPADRKAGGNALEWDLKLRIWGFVGYEYGQDDDTTQDIIENEARLITSILYLNRKNLGMDDIRGLKDVGLLSFTDIDVHGFGSGDDVHVAQGTLSITLSENFTL